MPVGPDRPQLPVMTVNGNRPDAAGNVKVETFEVAPPSAEGAGKAADAKAVYDALEGKQKTLSSTQMSAANSGITAEKVSKLDGVEAGAQKNPDLSAYAKKADIPAAPDLTSYAKTSDVTTALAKKQDKLTAGENIDIAEDGTISVSGVGTSISEVTHADLKTLRDNGKLVAGMQYRITDYVATTVQAHTQSANHPFDIIVTADSTNKLNEVARAIRHDGDTYFVNSKVESWQIWYSLDNDTNRFGWADSTNGKGVIYRMIDEWDNDLPYDFKGILTKAYRGGSWGSDYLYTFGGSEDQTVKTDLSCYSNKMEARFLFSTQMINQNTFGPECYNNTFGSGCYNNTFGLNCYENAFGSGCSGNSFDLDCYNNTFGSGSSHNTFGSNCSYNTFGSSCAYNTFGSNCSDITFDTYCAYNDFGSECSYFIFGLGCSHNTFGSFCQYISFGSSSSYNTFGSGCSNNSFVSHCSYHTFGSGCSENAFGSGCSGNAFGSNCSGNAFGSNCYGNAFGSNCYGNTFGSSCYENTFGSSCYYNTLTDFFSATILQNSVAGNTIDCTKDRGSYEFCTNIEIKSGVCDKGINIDDVNQTYHTEIRPENSITITI